MESSVIEVGSFHITYRFYVIYPCIFTHELPYKTYSSVVKAGFRCCFPGMNYCVRFHINVGLAQAYPNKVKLNHTCIIWCYLGLRM